MSISESAVGGFKGGREELKHDSKMLAGGPDPEGAG